MRFDVRASEDDGRRYRSGLQVRHETQTAEGPIHQCPDPVIPGTLTQRGRRAFQGPGRSQADRRFSRRPIPAGAPQPRQADPVATVEIT